MGVYTHIYKLYFGMVTENYSSTRFNLHKSFAVDLYIFFQNQTTW